MQDQPLAAARNRNLQALGRLPHAHTLAATMLVTTIWATPASAHVTLVPLGSFASGTFDASAAEVVAHDAHTQRLFVTNFEAATLDVLDIAHPNTPYLEFQIDLTPFGDHANSVAVRRGLVAVAIEPEDPQAPGLAVFFSADGVFLNQVTVGAMPDMLTFTPDGRRVIVANEGEPNDDYTVDPQGSVSVIDLRHGVGRLNVRTANFNAFNNGSIDPAVRIFGPGATVAQDLEPEYVSVSSNSRWAWITLQENNAMALLDVRRAKIRNVWPLGFKNHALEGNALDPSNKDKAISIANWPVEGMYQPDEIATYRHHGHNYVVMANEGDARDYEGYSEESRVKDLSLDPDSFPGAAQLQDSSALGRLKVTLAGGDLDNDGDYDKLYSYGARSFSIRSWNGRLIYDSGDDFAQIIAMESPDDFNSNNDENDSFDARSDDKGTEPEALTLARLWGRDYAFIGLERQGGIMIYDISNPHDPEFVDYVTTRDFAGNAELGTSGDLGPETLLFINRWHSPNHRPLLVSANEVSGTTTIFEIVRS
ncbi:MAG: choice-of-anchor I family protein [Nannocystaceae bacterium]